MLGSQISPFLHATSLTRFFCVNPRSIEGVCFEDFSLSRIFLVFKTCATHVPEKVFVSQISLAFKNLISEFFFYLRHPCSREGVGFADFGARLEVTAVNLVDNLV